MDEQLAIVGHIDKTSADIDAATARARQQIELMGEYRTRLVADVVTGKLDVRETASRLPDEEDDDCLEDAALGNSLGDDDDVSEEPAECSSTESEVTA